MDRIVVTGVGAITGLGQNLANTWERLLCGESAVAPVTLFDVTGCRCQQAASASLPDCFGLSPRQQARLSRASQLALAAAHSALRNAQWSTKNGTGFLPVSASTTGGAMALGEEFVQAGIEQRLGKKQWRLLTHYQPQQQILDLQKHLGFHGPSTIIANACASGANAIGHAADLLRAGTYDYILTGGWEALTELIFVGFDCLQALTKEKCRPFDKNRSGLVLGEGAAFLFLEKESHAMARGATILAELTGYGHTTDLHHLTQPHPTGEALVRAMQMAAQQANITPEKIAYVNAHGTGTMLNDASESRAYAEFFGEYPVGVSSTKAALGHTLGAAGAIEAALTVQALQTGVCPPQINLETIEPLLRQKLVPLAGARVKAEWMMSVNLGFGGSNAALIFRNPDIHKA